MCATYCTTRSVRDFDLINMKTLLKTHLHLCENGLCAEDTPYSENIYGILQDVIEKERYRMVFMLFCLYTSHKGLLRDTNICYVIVNNSGPENDPTSEKIKQTILLNQSFIEIHLNWCNKVSYLLT